ncbi:MAG: FeoA family protein [Arcanobacterium sp.]
MTLAECPVRAPLRLTRVGVLRRNLLRMQELGLRVGAHVSVVQRGAFGGLVLNVAGSRVAVDHRSARVIEADVINDAGVPVGPGAVCAVPEYDAVGGQTGDGE